MDHQGDDPQHDDNGGGVTDGIEVEDDHPQHQFVTLATGDAGHDDNHVILDEMDDDKQQEQEQHNPAATDGHPLEMCVCVLVCAVSVTIEFISLKPHERPIPFQILLNTTNYYLEDPRFANPMTAESVSSAALVLVSLIIPVLLQSALSRFQHHPKSDIYRSFCVYFLASGLTLLAVDITKAYVGYLRPNFYDACQPNPTYSTCDEDDFEDARLSFPSGHAGISFCGFTIFTLYIHSQFGMGFYMSCYNDHRQQQPDDSRGKPPSIFLCRFISIMAFVVNMSIAMFIATSRIVDNYHFPADVVAGAVMGSVIAHFIFDLWFLPI